VKRLIVVPDDNSDPDDSTKINVGEQGLEQAAITYGALGIEVLVVRFPKGRIATTCCASRAWRPWRYWSSTLSRSSLPNIVPPMNIPSRF
jgi:hypothetical protein